MATTNTHVDPVVRMDSRKFLGTLNDSAQAKVAFFEDRIKQMGREAGHDYQLTALHAKQLYFEDAETGNYFIAEHSRDKGGKVNITNIRPVEIVEEEKQDLFNESCLRLVSAVEENDQKGMQAAFGRMKAQRFSGRVVPYSGYIKSRDGIIRKVNVATGDSLNEETRTSLIKAIVEGLRDRVIVENGRVVSGHFRDGDEIKLPVTKWAARKLVAKRMRDTAANAFWSEGFQKRIRHTARLVSEGKIEGAVRSLTPFLDENEEFTLLTRGQAQTLVENALAANTIFNDNLCRDTATLFHRTNMKISRNKIIDEWRNIARKAEHPVLAENVQILEEATNFEAAYNKFLELIFEAISNKEVAAEALATTLQALKEKTPKIKESHDLSSKLDNLIVRLKQKDFDDAAIYEAEDLIATIQEELAATDTLQNFDQIPGDMGADLEEPLDVGGGDAGQPVISINSPLIQVGGQSSAGGAGGGEEDILPPEGGEEPALPPEEEPALPPEEEGGNPEDELAAILGGGGAGGGLGESARRRGRSIKESRPQHYEMKDEGDDDDPLGDTDDPMDQVENADPYAIHKGEFDLSESNNIMMDYGAPVITDEKDLRKVVTIMGRLAKEHRLRGKALEENLFSMAQAGIKAIGLRIPQGRLNRAIEECVILFRENKPFPGAAEPFGKKDSDTDADDGDSSGGSGKPWEKGSSSSGNSGGGSGKPWEKGNSGSSSGGSSKPWDDDDDDDDDGDDPFSTWSDDDEGVAEDQYKSPRIRGRGFRKSSYAPRELKNEAINREKALNEGIYWGESQPDGVLGQFAGVNFIFDHGGDSDLKPVVLSEDGSVEIPIPENLYNSAFASAGIIEGDDSRFTQWLLNSIEQLRPISEEEDAAIAEAMATITTTPEGGISVEVSDDVSVGDAEGDMGMDDEYDAAGMEPVDAVDTEMPGEEMPGEEMPGEEMPDYEGEMGMDDGMGGGLEDDGMGGGMEDDGMGGGMGGGMKGGMKGGMGNMGDEEITGDYGEEEDDMIEDKDVTQPRSNKYTKHVKENPRDMPDHKPTKDTDDDLDEIGPDMKQDDGSGTKPPTAKSMSKE